MSREEVFGAHCVCVSPEREDVVMTVHLGLVREFRPCKGLLECVTSFHDTFLPVMLLALLLILCAQCRRPSKRPKIDDCG